MSNLKLLHAGFAKVAKTFDPGTSDNVGTSDPREPNVRISNPRDPRSAKVRSSTPLPRTYSEFSMIRIRFKLT